MSLFPWQEVLNRVLPEAHLGPLLVNPQCLLSEILTVRQTDWLTVTDRGSIGIYNFITSKVSFRFVIRVICLHSHIACFPGITLFIQKGHPVPESPYWRLSQRSIYNIRSAKQWIITFFILTIFAIQCPEVVRNRHNEYRLSKRVFFIVKTM